MTQPPMSVPLSGSAQQAAKLTVHPRVGVPGAPLRPAGPATMVAGGGRDVADGFVRLQSLIAPHTSGRAGDLVVLRTTGTNAYDAFIHEVAPFSSVRTVVISPESSLAQQHQAAALVDEADAVFWAGGAQNQYVALQGPLMEAVQRVPERGGGLGGTSAGATLMGEVIYDAVSAGDFNVSTRAAVADPLTSRISFTEGLFNLLPGVLVDTHFGEGNRFGRLAAFLANHQVSHPDRAPLLGVGVDAGAALVGGQAGKLTLLHAGRRGGSAYFLRLLEAPRVEAGQPLRCLVEVERLSEAGQTFDLAARTGDGQRYRVWVDGAAPALYSVNPYEGP